MYDNPKPSLNEVREILEKITQGIRVLQRADMVHRDLKPENIMLQRDGEIKIIDLGAVLVRGLKKESRKQRRHSIRCGQLYCARNHQAQYGDH